MRRTAIGGHALQYEGRSAVADLDPSHLLRLVDLPVGFGWCECGARSPILPSTAARQRWHRDVHKPAVRERMLAKGVIP